MADVTQKERSANKSVVLIKVYEKILEQRLKQSAEIQIEQSQRAFHKVRSIQDNIFALKQIIERKRTVIYVA